MTPAKKWAMAASLSLLVSNGCSVEQQEPAEAPDVDVNVDPGRWPEYKVNWADIDVGTSERTITVPVVRIEKETRQITVPFIDINPPGAGDTEERVIAIALDVPHVGYELNITEVRASGDDLWVISRLQEPQKPAAQGVTRVSDRVVIDAPENLDVRRVVVGARPGGVENEDVRFVESMSQVDQIIPSQGRVLYRRSG